MYYGFVLSIAFSANIYHTYGLFDDIQVHQLLTIELQECKIYKKAFKAACWNPDCFALR